jgi:putative flippase GtrA
MPEPALVRRWWPLVVKLVRYASVSAVATTTSLVTLTLLVTCTAMSPGWANIVATALGTVPSFELNRRWVWARADRRSLTRQVIPFVALTVVELTASTLAVQAAGQWALDHGVSHLARAVIVDGANIVAFGTLWVVQFVVCDRLLFRARTPQPAPGPC